MKNIRSRVGIGFLTAAVAIGLMMPAVVNAATQVPFANTSQIQMEITGIQQTLASGKPIKYQNLSSAINGASKDQNLQRCLASYTDTAVSAGRCVAGSAKSTAKLVVAYGDSHLWQWIGALDAVARLKNWKLVTYAKASCLNTAAIFTINSSQTAPANMLNKPYSQCATWRESVLKEIATAKPYFIVTSGNTRPENLYTWPGQKSISVASATSAMMSRLSSYVGGNPSRVFVILDTPYGGIGDNSAAACLSFNPQLTPNPSPKSAWPHGSTYCYRPWSYDYTAPTVRESVRSSAVTSGVTVIDPSQWFCTVGDTGICPPIIAQTMTYMDKAHIARSYSLLLVNVLGASFPKT